MAEQTTDIRRINWSECCGWFPIFRSFRMAIHPSKLGLAVIGVILVGLWGWILDGLWPGNTKPLQGELNAFWQTSDIQSWRQQTKEARAGELQLAYERVGMQVPEDLRTRYVESPADTIDRAQRALKTRYEGLPKQEDAEARARTADEYNRTYAEMESMRPQGVFTSFMNYEAGMMRQCIQSALSLNFTGRLDEVMSARQQGVRAIEPSVPVGTGLLPALVLAARGKQWLIGQHFVFAILLGIVTLLIWALIGGAICRIAAMEAARDERISPNTAVKFARRKYLGFFTAPLLPIALVVLIGILLAIGGLITAIPYIGEILGGLGMILGLIGGFIIALVVIGAAAGGSLFYPTVAVEGSDSFDAMSRSYSYVYSRPWRAIWYGLVAFVYGSLCYLFVRFFVLLLLKATRLCVNVGMWGTHRPDTGQPWATKLDAMWPMPSFTNLRGTGTAFGMIHWEPVGSFLIWLWVMLVIVLLASFVLTFYFSASTIIYLLLRRDVDATDMDDVYQDEVPEEEAPPTTEPAGGPAPGGAAPGEPVPGEPVQPPPVEPPVPPPPSEGGPPAGGAV